MPVFFQHHDADFRLMVWSDEEPESFFLEDLPESLGGMFPAHPLKRKQFLAGRFLLTQLVPNFPLQQIRIAEGGRPFLEQGSPYFSISHTSKYIAAIVHEQQAVGIDVEQVSDRVLRVGNKFLSMAEQQLIQVVLDNAINLTQTILYTLAWSVKEASFKALHQTGLDFMRDLPIENIEWMNGFWRVEMGGKGSELEIHAHNMGPVCLAIAVRKV
jgi:phosphopantetheinyl transferase